MAATPTTVTAPKQSWLGKLIGLPPGENLVWFMIGKQRGFWKQLAALSGFLLIFGIAYRDPWAALAMMGGMYFHEIGHLIVFMANGIKALIMLLFPLGAVAAPVTKEEDARSDLLPWWNIGWLLQAGPTMNVVQMIIGLLFIHFGFLPLLGQQMVFINGMLAAFNLLPLWNMDGGQLFHVIFSSLKEEWDVVLAGIGIMVSFAIVGVILLSPIGLGGLAVLRALFMNFGVIIFLILLAAGMWHKQGKDNPLHWKSKQAMSVKQVLVQLAYYLILVGLTLFLLTV